MLRVLLTINGLCIGIGWTEALVAENTIKPGDKVMVVNWNVRLGTKNTAKLTADLGEVFHVGRTQDRFLWIPRKRAWIRKTDVIEFSKAIEYFTERIRKQPSPEAYQSRGIAWIARQDYDKAIADFDEAIRRDPSISGLYNNRGNARRKKRSLDAAIADYSKAIQLDARNVRAYNNRSLAWAEKQQHRKAIADATTALTIDPHNSAAYNNRGVSWRELAEYTKAIADYNQAIRLTPNDAIAFGNRGFAWKQKGNYRKALEDYRHAVKLDPVSSDVLNDLAWLLATCRDKSLRDGKRAVAHAERACQLTQFKDWNQLDTLAAAHAQAGDFKKAAKWAAESLKRAPKPERPTLRKHLERFASGKAL